MKKALFIFLCMFFFAPTVYANAVGRFQLHLQATHRYPLLIDTEKGIVYRLVKEGKDTLTWFPYRFVNPVSSEGSVYDGITASSLWYKVTDPLDILDVKKPPAP